MYVTTHNLKKLLFSSIQYFKSIPMNNKMDQLTYIDKMRGSPNLGLT